MPDVFRETGSYYVLGFQPEATASAGQFHRIDVKLNRSDVTVQSRRGYYTPSATQPPGTESPAASAVTGLWPDVQLPLTMTAAPFAAGGLGTPAVIVTVGLAGAPGPPAGSGALHVFTGAFDRQGKALVSAQQEWMAEPGTGEVISRLSLSPGRYELRAGVARAADQRTGSVYGYVDVPDFLHDPISLSGIVLTRAGAPPPLGVDTLRGVAPDVPTAVRAFSASDHVRASLDIYEGVSRPILPVYVRVRVVDQDNQEVVNRESRLLADRFSSSRAVAFSFDLPLAGLAPGAYWTNVEVIHGNDRRSRDVRFTVRP
jgi:hypothetical protein